MIECTVWWARPLSDTGRFYPLLSTAEAERYGAYRQEADRRRFLTGRVLAKTVLAHRLDIPAARVELDARCPDCVKQHGPPQLPGSALAISISHSADRVGLAVTGGGDIGLDVEATTRRADDSLLSYALNDTELAALDGLTDSERARAFFTYWTRKEALMKATGRGLRIALSGITLSGHDAPARLVSATDQALSPERTLLADLAPGEGYSAAVAVLGAASDDVAGGLTVTQRWLDSSSELLPAIGVQPHGAQQGGELG